MQTFRSSLNGLRQTAISMAWLFAGMLFMLGIGTVLAQTATPPDGTVVPNFDGMEVYSATSDLTDAVLVKKENAGSDEGAVKGVINTPSTSWVGGYLGYAKDATSLYGLYSKADAGVEGNLFVDGIVYTENLQSDSGDLSVEASGVTDFSGNVWVDGAVGASSIGSFYQAEAQDDTTSVAASCDSSEHIVIGCAGYAMAGNYLGTLQYADGCVANRESSASGTLWVQTFCFDPTGVTTNSTFTDYVDASSSSGGTRGKDLPIDFTDSDAEVSTEALDEVTIITTP